ncbi:accessory gene regulator B family protein [Paenibacillus sedimenti]|uniref:Accessory gene regulator B family protein n=1 Tax=Paenibacillus sedimenti TaxID=2770274 RepID=A0A926KS87_9BACL|nr:accessory gene regulator B family protein [Paenibacillus sedimenti]MBD0381254.1 accessory gene regulator B family protein [Paenibacillus sedimenti]
MILLITVDKLAHQIANSIHKNAPEFSPAILKYMLSAILNLLITVIIVLVIAGFTGHFLDAFLCVWAFPLLRHFSGGMHFKSNTICNVVSSFFILLAIFLPVNYWYEGLVLNIIAVSILLINAPQGVKGTIDPKFYPVLKVISVLIVASNFLFQSHILTLVFLIQALTTFSLFQKLIDKLKL